MLARPDRVPSSFYSLMTFRTPRGLTGIILGLFCPCGFETLRIQVF
jgi:hypothetical protein